MSRRNGLLRRIRDEPFSKYNSIVDDLKKSNVTFEIKTIGLDIKTNLRVVPIFKVLTLCTIYTVLKWNNATKTMFFYNYVLSFMGHFYYSFVGC